MYDNRMADNKKDFTRMAEFLYREVDAVGKQCAAKIEIDVSDVLPDSNVPMFQTLLDELMLQNE